MLSTIPAKHHSQVNDIEARRVEDALTAGLIRLELNEGFSFGSELGGFARPRVR